MKQFFLSPLKIIGCCAPTDERVVRTQSESKELKQRLPWRREQKYWTDNCQFIRATLPLLLLLLPPLAARRSHLAFQSAATLARLIITAPRLPRVQRSATRKQRRMPDNKLNGLAPAEAGRARLDLLNQSIKRAAGDLMWRKSEPLKRLTRLTSLLGKRKRISRLLRKRQSLIRSFAFAAFAFAQAHLKRRVQARKMGAKRRLNWRWPALGRANLS